MNGLLIGVLLILGLFTGVAAFAGLTLDLIYRFTGSAGSCRCPYCSRRTDYWRDMARRISLSVSVMRSPDRSIVTVWSVPVKWNGAR